MIPTISHKDHIHGPAEAALALVEYGDFECPYSAQAVQTVKRIQQSLKDRLRFIFRHFPLMHKHRRAFRAAEAAEAAAAQGKFWEMYHLLFSHQQNLTDPDLALYALSLGLDTNRFARDMGAHAYETRVQADLRGGKGAGVTGTPTFFINGRRYDEDDDGELMAALQQELHLQAGKPPRSGSLC